MSDKKVIPRRYSHSRRASSQNNTSVNMNTLTNSSKSSSELCFAKRNHPTIISLTPFSDDEKPCYRWTKTDKTCVYAANYPIISTSTASSLSLTLENNNYPKQDKLPMLPKLTPRAENTLNVFPSLTARSVSLNSDRRTSVSSIRTPLRPISMSTTKLPDTNAARDSIDDARRITLRKY